MPPTEEPLSTILQQQPILFIRFTEHLDLSKCSVNQSDLRSNKIYGEKRIPMIALWYPAFRNHS